MARVPTLTEPRVSLDPMTDAKFRPVETGGALAGLSAGLQQIGGTLDRVAAAQARMRAERDEGDARAADNELVSGAEAALAGGKGAWLGLRGAAAVEAQPAAEAALAKRAAAIGAGLASPRARAMFDGVAAQRLDGWRARIAAHAASEAEAHNRAQSDVRQALAQQEMARAAAAGEGPAFESHARTLLGEIHARAARDGLDPPAAEAAADRAFATVYAGVVDRLAASDPERALAYLDAHRAAIGESAAARREAMLRPFVAAQQAERAAAQIRAGGGDAAERQARIAALGLDPETVGLVAHELAHADRADQAAAEARQRAAADSAWALAMDPAHTSLRAIPPALWAELAPGEQAAIGAALAANARGGEAPPDPALYLSLSDKAAEGRLSLDDVRHAWGHLADRQWQQIAGWQRDVAGAGDTSDTSALLRRVRGLAGAVVPDAAGAPDPVKRRAAFQQALLRDVAVYRRQNDGRMPDDRALEELARGSASEVGMTTVLARDRIRAMVSQPWTAGDADGGAFDRANRLDDEGRRNSEDGSPAEADDHSSQLTNIDFRPLDFPSGYVRRSNHYSDLQSRLDRNGLKDSKYFRAVSLMTANLANMDTMFFIGHFANIQGDVRAYMEGLSQRIADFNDGQFEKIVSGRIRGSGRDIDRKLVLDEQHFIQTDLIALSRRDRSLYSRFIEAINRNANRTGMLAGMNRLTDSTIVGAADGARKAIGGPINFANIAHRIIMGNMMLDAVRQDEALERRLKAVRTSPLNAMRMNPY